MVMTGMLSVVDPGSHVQMALAILNMMGFMLITLKLAPYESDVDDVMSFLTSLALVLTTMAGFALLMDARAETKTFDTEMLGIIIIITNSIMSAIELVCIIYIECYMKRKAQTEEETTSGNNNNKNMTKISPTPSSNSTTPGAFKVDEDNEDNQAHVEYLMSIAAEAEEGIHRQSSRGQRLSRANVEEKIAERCKIRQTRAMEL